MAAQNRGLLIPLELTEKQFVKQLARSNAELNKHSRKMEAALKKALNDNKVRKFNRSLDKTSHSAKKVSGAFSQMGRSVAVLEGPLGGVAGRFGAISGAIGAVNPVIAAGAVALASAGVAVAKSLKAFEKFEVQQLRTKAVLKATSYSAGRTSEQLERLAQSVGFDTLASTSGVRDAIDQLLTFRSISGDTFDRTIRLSQDLATVGFGSLSSSAVQLGKALEDPVTGLSALRRIGVSFSQSQREMIQNFVATGQVAKAQNTILDAVEKQVGGAGRASGEGLAGAYDGLSEATGILLENWGNQIAQATGLTKAIKGIASAIDEVNQRGTVPSRLDGVNEQLARVDASLSLRSGTKSSRVDHLLVKKQALLAEQKAIFKEIDQSSVTAYEAYEKSLEAKRQADTERYEGVLASQQKLIDQAKMSPLQRAIDANLNIAGVSADSERGQEIAQITARAMALQAESKQRTKVAAATLKQSEKVQAIIAALELEREQMGLSAVERRVQNELIAAGSDATVEQKRKIELLARANETLAQKQSQSAELSKFMGQQISSQFQLITSAIDTGNSALDMFIQNLLNAGMQAAMFGTGPLSGLFGGASDSGGGGGIAGLISSVASSFGGFFSKGGNLGAGKWGIAGEGGVPEVIHGPAQITPFNKLPQVMAGSGKASMHIRVDAAPELYAKVVSISGEMVRGAAPEIVEMATQQSRQHTVGDLNEYNSNRGSDHRV